MMRRFYFHYNKPASRAAGKVQVSLHYRGKCYILDNLECLVPTEGVVRKRQPYWVMRGRCRAVNLLSGKVAVVV